MATATIKYLGDLRTQCTHLQSGNTIITDAPIDNHGKGEAFSPTDLVATALGSCMLTIMAIKANEMAVEIKDTTVSVTKIMLAEPRKIAKINVEIHMSISAPEKERIILERVAMNCPVLLSLNPDIEKQVIFHWK